MQVQQLLSFLLELYQDFCKVLVPKKGFFHSIILVGSLRSIIYI